MPLSSILTVVTPATNRQLADSDRFMELTGITDTKQADNVDWLNTAASRVFEKKCNRVFAKQAYSEQIRMWSDPPGRVSRRGLSVLQLAAYPILATPAITVTENGIVLVQGTDFEIDYPTGQLTRLIPSGTTPATTAAIQWSSGITVITYTAGYSLPNDTSPTLPADIEAAAVSLMRSGWFSVKRDPMVKQEDVPGVYSVSYWVGAIGSSDSSLPQDVCDAIEDNRVPNIG